MNSRKRWMRRISIAVAVVALSGSLAGCLQISGVGGGTNASTGKGSASFSASVADGFKEIGANQALLSCFNAILDEAVATEVHIFYAVLGAFMVCVDPLLVEVPTTVTNPTGTVTLGVVTEPLVIEGPFQCVTATPGQQICARAGRHLFVVDAPVNGTLPQGSSTVDIDLDFDMNPVAEFEARVISTAKVQAMGGDPMYPPLFPCTTNFADALAVTIPVANGSQPISLDFTGLSVCQQHNINLAGGGAGNASAPAMGLSALALTGAGLLLGGRRLLRRRSTAAR